MAQDYGLRHATLVLDGTEQSLLEAFGNTQIGGPDDLAILALILQPDGANGNPVYVGADGVTANDYAFRMEAGAAGVPPVPFILELAGARTKPSRWKVIGTNTQKLHIGLVAY